MLKAALEHLGLRQVELALLLAVSPRTVNTWAAGSCEIPGPVAAYLRVLGQAGPDVVAAELGRLTTRSKMLDEGLYGLRYQIPEAPPDAQPEPDQALAVLRSGKILGSDRWGAVFTGSYDFDTPRSTNRFDIRLELPPDGELVTGYRAGPGGASLTVSGVIDRAAPRAVSTVEIDGAPIRLELTYLGPLPR